MVLHVTMGLYGLNSREGEKKTGKKKAAGGGIKFIIQFSAFIFNRTNWFMGKRGVNKLREHAIVFCKCQAYFFTRSENREVHAQDPKFLIKFIF